MSYHVILIVEVSRNSFLSQCLSSEVRHSFYIGRSNHRCNFLGDGFTDYRSH
jgi:hypothetical protein